MGSSSSRTSSYPGNRTNSAGGQNRPNDLPTPTPRTGGSMVTNTTASNYRPSTARPSAPGALPTVNPVQTMTRPGAYSIVPQTSSSSAPLVYRVTIPPHAVPNNSFEVYAGSRIVRVRCPNDARPGQTIQITVPPEPVVTPLSASVARLTSADETIVGGGAVRMNSEVRLVNERDLRIGEENRNREQHQQQQQQQQPLENQQPRRYHVVIPANIRPGMVFPVSVEGRRITVRCPEGAAPGSTVSIIPPSPPPSGMQVAVDVNRPPDNTSNQDQLNYTTAPPTRVEMQTFEVVIPNGVRPNQTFAAMAGGQRVLLSCPPNSLPGSRIRFKLPVGSSSANHVSSNSLSKSAQLKYDTKDGWSRSLRLSDMRFIWVRTNVEGNLDTEFSSSGQGESVVQSRFHTQKSAYVRRLVFLKGNDPRLRTGLLSLVPASESSTASSVCKEDDTEVISYSELSSAVSLPFKDKMVTFRSLCKRLECPWETGHIRINIRRDKGYFLDDSIKAIMSLDPSEFRKIWRFEFIGEDGIDAGGLAREWFHLVTLEIFDADGGLWMSRAGSNQMHMHINPATAVSCPDDYLIYFRFLGRVMGKALFDGQLISGHMAGYLYKHLLGWPVTFEDLTNVDENIYQNLKKLSEMSADDIENMCLDFTLSEEILGAKTQVDLVANGKDISVTIENLSQYLEANLKYRLMGSTVKQLNELLLGFFDVIPEPLITIFNFQELELAMCGLPEIDVSDWIENTSYTGTFALSKDSNSTCKWFWEIVRNDFDQEMRARLLQFVTGTSGVPSRGFSVLQGNDGNIRKFTIHGIDDNPTAYPRAHTCFNRIDLPSYKSKADMLEKLQYAVMNSATGFYIQ